MPEQMNNDYEEPHVEGGEIQAKVGRNELERRRRLEKGMFDPPEGPVVGKPITPYTPAAANPNQHLRLDEWSGELVNPYGKELGSQRAPSPEPQKFRPPPRGIDPPKKKRRR